MSEYSVDVHLGVLSEFIKNDEANLICQSVDEKKTRLIWHASVRKFSETAKELHDSKVIGGIAKHVKLSVEYGIMLGLEAALPEKGNQTGANMVAKSIITLLIPQYRPTH